MYKLSTDYKEELKQYRAFVSDALRGEVDEIQFKIFRVVRGIYEQRSKGTYMVRMRCTGGIITPKQLIRVSEIAKKYNSSTIHITTRQEIQLHNLQLKDTPDILDELYVIGLSTKGTGGNTVRNITASIESGISENDVFDISPYNVALANMLVNYDKSFDLPRKLKIAFSSSDNDTALAVFNDLGFIAKIKDGQKGFKVYLGGAPTVRPMIGEVLFEFLPVNNIFAVTLAVIEMFNTHGNRKNRHKARLRYLFYKLGKEKVFELFNETYNLFKNEVFEEVHGLDVEMLNPPKINIDALSDDGSEKWREDYVVFQKQEHLCSIEIPIMHGNLSPSQAKGIAEFAGKFGNDTIRFSRKQNIHLRNIPKAYIDRLYQTLINIDIEVSKPYILGSIVSCTGADTCQLGICFSKGGLHAIHDRLSENEDLQNLKKVNINISGCPNSCGQHLVADLGFAGRVSRNKHIYPSYNIFAGAVVGTNKPMLPIRIGEVAAKDLPEFTNDILNFYKKDKTGESFRAFVEKEAVAIEKLVNQYKNIPSYEENNTYYMDWGNNGLFSLESRGSGECSAGLLDLIESELNILAMCKESFLGQQEAKEQTVLLHEMVLSAAKLLNLTLHNQGSDVSKLFENIKLNLIPKGYISNNYDNIFKYILEGNFTALLRQKERVLNFVDNAISYYQGLDDNLQFKLEVRVIKPSELKSLIDNQTDIQLIDVREKWEKDIADIGGKLIPADNFNPDTVSLSDEKKTVLYCHTGKRSEKVYNVIASKMTLNNLYVLKGGINAWADEVDQQIQKY